MATFPEQHTITIFRRWTQHVPLKCSYPPTRLHVVNTQKVKLEILATVKTSFFTGRGGGAYEKISSTRLSVCVAIPATKPSRIFMRFGTRLATKSCRASVSWKLVETFGTLLVLTESLPCLPYFSTDFTQIGYGIPVVRNATEQLRVS